MLYIEKRGVSPNLMRNQEENSSAPVGTVAFFFEKQGGIKSGKSV
jgi:hypothetical protein